MVGAREHIDKVINLHQVYLSLILSMEEELKVFSDDLAVLQRLNNLIRKIKEKIGQDVQVIQDVEISEQWLDQYRFETLNEAQVKSCITCYMHSLLSEKALTPLSQYSDSVYERAHYRFILLYKLTDALRIYHYWTDIEHDFNETKVIMMCAYVVGIILSACVTAYMFDHFWK